MGFGYLLIGYVVTFVLQLLLSQLGFGSVALLVGFSVMLRGLWTLTHYQKTFFYAGLCCLPLLLFSLFSLVMDFGEAFSWNLALPASLLTAVEWSEFLLIILFHMAVLFAVRILAKEVELPHVAAKAVTNLLFVGIYALFFVLTQMPDLLGEETVRYLSVPLILSDILFVALDILLFLSCAKNICPEGEDEPERVRYRLDFLNKIEDAYEKKQQENLEKAKQEALARKQKKDAQKKKH